MDDFANVLKTITFWELESPYPYELWEYMLDKNTLLKHDISKCLGENLENAKNMHFEHRSLAGELAGSLGGSTA